MKKAGMIFPALGLTALLFSCSNGNLGEKAGTSEAKEVKNVEGEKIVYALNSESSVIKWMGSKPTGTHDGEINIKSGEFVVLDSKIVGGEFVIDMKSIVNHDLEDQEWNTKLVNHLHSSDFFDTEVYPEAKFVITSVEDFNGIVAEGHPNPTHSVTGNLTIKEITKSITFNAIVNPGQQTITAESVPFVIDRADWDVKYKSKKFFDNLKDDFIHDDIGLVIKVETAVKS